MALPLHADPAPGRPARARLVVVVATLLLTAVVVLLVTRGTADEGSGTTGRDVVEAVLADEPEAPVVLPVTVPRGFVLALGESARRAPGEGTVAAWVFEPVQAGSQLAGVQLYVDAPGRSGAPPEGVLALESDGREVWVIPAGEDAGRARSLELWDDVALTGDWETLEWIDEPLAR